MLSLAFWRSGETKVQYGRRLLVGIDALACILAIGLDENAIVFLVFG